MLRRYIMNRNYTWPRLLIALFILILPVIGHGASLVANSSLTAPDGEPFDLFGLAVDIAPDAGLILVGASRGTSSIDSGSAYIFSSLSTFSGIKITADTPTPGDDFGAAVALSDDKTTVIVGAPDTQVGINAYQGAAYIFTSAGGWAQQQKLVAPDGRREAFFGCSVDISDDGDTVIVGSCSNAGMNNMISKVYIFIRQGTSWSLQESFRGSDTEADDAFACSVAISGDGNTALVGAFMDHLFPNIDHGSAYVFIRDGVRWFEQQKLTGDNSISWSSLGKAVDLSSDGNTALIGDDTKDNTGAAYVYTRPSVVWSLQSTLLPSAPDPYFNRFGQSVALSNTGALAIVGDSGAAYLYSSNGTGWTEQQRLVSGNTDTNDFGDTVALSEDGKTVLVGAPGGTGPGRVYVFRPSVLMVGPNFLLLEKKP